MGDRKESVYLIDGSQKDITIGYLSMETKNNIFKECIQFGAKGQEIEVQKIDYFGLKIKVLQNTLRGTTVDELREDEGEKIFDKYFGKILESLGGGQGN